jgi:hypothetical protein
MAKWKNKLAEMVLRVGDGRGFVVPLKSDRYIITAAHCLPKFPPRASISTTWERTYANLLAPLGKRRSVWAECLFVDPVADIAVLGSPDTQELPDEAEAYDRLVEAMTPLQVSDIQGETSTAELLPLREGERLRCVVKAIGRGPLWIFEARTFGGMSGSPILAEDGSAIGVVAGTNQNPRLASHLPGWLLGDLGLRSRKIVTAKERRAHRRLKRIKIGSAAAGP